jgi:tryptophan synthase alpha chain
MRLRTTLQQFKQNKRKALSLFITAGYPKLETTVPFVVALADAGADLIELGIPFSDPVADGPTIQHSSDIALRNGMTLQKTFEMAKEIRRQREIPIILMGYANPIFIFGLDNFMKACASIGIDGTIIADLPPEESHDYRISARLHDIAAIFLATPTTSNERLKELGTLSDGFLYCVSVTGVTGTRQGVAEEALTFLRRAREQVVRNPLLVGFGISSPEDARHVAPYSDGIIIGSALMKLISDSSAGSIESAIEFVRSMRKALDESTLNPIV